ncbi:fumarylacetoacetate hydrolase family protein [Cohnella caldifontis]|uniref:fumarylacetoacetate hydrolase family protein n=1 Tax=Cohnella caldifontis TaxID=3027471 RepID=UPI0023EB2C36|nr:fumarylacetoacetate hydrolase family protein [Cohnella sp. YIM B05605]
MKLVTFTREGRTRIGRLEGSRITDLNYAVQLWLKSQGKYRYREIAEAYVPPEMVGFLQGGRESMDMAERACAYVEENPAAASAADWKLSLQLGEVKLEAPVTTPNKIVCVGHNYREHIREMGREIPQFPVIFAKYANTIIGPQDDIPYPSVTNQLDYEAEFAFVIGKRASKVSKADALDYVAGYTIVNDVTSRDLQRRTIQWLQGKTVDGSAPMGPYLVTKDEIEDPYRLNVELRVNGELRQKTNTANFVFNVHDLVEFLSGFMTLEPGDVVCTGTPGGVGVAMDPPVFLQDGDVVRIDIDRLGTLENRVRR